MDVLKDLANLVGLEALAANRTHFYLEVKGLPEDMFTVRSFEGDRHGISDDYHFTVRVDAQQPPSPERVIGKPVVLTLMWDARPVWVHGVVTDISHAGDGVDAQQHDLTFHSPLTVLRKNRQNRVFLNKDVRQIVEDVLLAAGFDAASFEFKLNEAYPVREFTVQYEESDYDFMARLMAHYGLFYVFSQEEDQARLRVFDAVEELPRLDGTGSILYQEQSGQVRPVESVFALRRQARLLASEVRLKDYNYRTPEADLETASKGGEGIPGAGAEYRYGENIKTLDEGDFIARIRQQALDWQRETFIAETDCRGLVPGVTFTLTGYPGGALDGDYLVIEVEHHGDQSAAFVHGDDPRKFTYRNKALLVRAGVPYRPRVLAGPAVHGAFTARVESTGGNYAYLDDQGRYRVRLAFDLSETQEGEASHPVRLMQNYAGREYGVHFPLHAGTEVAITCVNGDLDRPFMMGVLPNSDTPPPVTADNNSQNILRTWGGNELLMEDRKGEERTELFTRERKNILTLDANAEGHKVRLATEEGDMEHYAAKTMLVESGDSQTVQTGNDHIVTVENAQRLMTKNKEVEVQAATDIRLKAGDNIQMQAETEDIEMAAARDMIVDVNQSMSVEVRNQNLDILASAGKIGLEAAKAITVKGNGGGLIHIGQSGGAIEISTGGDLSVTGSASVNINGASINIKGGSIGNN